MDTEIIADEIMSELRQTMAAAGLADVPLGPFEEGDGPEGYEWTVRLAPEVERLLTYAQKRVLIDARIKLRRERHLVF